MLDFIRSSSHVEGSPSLGRSVEQEQDQKIKSRKGPVNVVVLIHLCLLGRCCAVITSLVTFPRLPKRGPLNLLSVHPLLPLLKLQQDQAVRSAGGGGAGEYVDLLAVWRRPFRAVGGYHFGDHGEREPAGRSLLADSGDALGLRDLPGFDVDFGGHD
jgi:hypothetical protein